MTMNRTGRVRRAMGLTPLEFAAKLGVHRTTVCRLENGKTPESGPVALLLDQLERDVEAHSRRRAS